MDGMDGILVFHKTCGISSHDAVQQLRRLTGIKRIGHLGTLDPIGTGVLPMLLGRTTRLARFFLHHERTYEAVIRFGFATDSYDRSGEPSTEARNVKLDTAQIEAVLPEFRGKLMQAPPPVSAKKVAGVPAYKLARQKKPVKLDPVEIHVYEFALLDVAGERATVRVRCSTGTYMRSLAHDLGRRLEVGAHVEHLCRTAMGEFTLDMAHSLEQLEGLNGEGRLEEALTPPQMLLPEMPAERVDAITAARITHGRDFRVSPFRNRQQAKLVKAIAPDGSLLAIAEARLPLLYHPIVVL